MGDLPGHAKDHRAAQVSIRRPYILGVIVDGRNNSLSADPAPHTSTILAGHCKWDYEKDIVYIRARIKDLSSLSLNSFGESFNKNLFLLLSSSWEKALQNIKSYSFWT